MKHFYTQKKLRLNRFSIRNFFVFFLILQCFILTTESSLYEYPNFEKSKKIAKKYIFFDQFKGKQGTLYCGCDWIWKKKGYSGIVDINNCEYKPRRKCSERSKYIEWEHIVPVSKFGKFRPCWKKGGRKYCSLTDRKFQHIESDLYNIAPVIGEINQDRKDFKYSEVKSNIPYIYGTCKSRIDFQKKEFEPRDEVKGQIARTFLYMIAKYRIRISEKEFKKIMMWNLKYPIDEWEREKSLRIEKITGIKNYFTTDNYQKKLEKNMSFEEFFQKKKQEDFYRRKFILQ
ncbi:endonuclease [Candidatus Riesia pediculicola]|uniref:endonuclease n=1 Tax=Candidatus Riesia pediculicola TaxID=401619 RepID=UPI0009C1C053|nr:endonuclease [Candidatus Riesia pediculicola]ARC54103.1 hypothetical protein AOE57_00495 [Candidatus Riesia pediculicola]